MSNWINEAIIYHIYTLGFCGATEQNSEDVICTHKIKKVLDWIEHLQVLGVNTILFGPLFESTSHGYDTSDYYKLDKRLGMNEDFKGVCKKLHEAGFRILLDGVFNHVGRDFFAFKDLQEKREASKYKDWFCNVNFRGSSPYGDSFSYEAWEGHYNLVKLNLWNQEVRDYLFSAVKMWIKEFEIDGLRLDVAYCIDEGFLGELRQFVDTQKEDFWLMGEMIHGDYSRLAKPGLLHSTTNYECYKGIYSSHNDKNYFEINYSMTRLLGRGGLCEKVKLYNFVDNHDVERIGSILKERRHLQNVYTLLLTMPGIPSIYYGSEWGIEGRKVKGTDKSLRPELDIDKMLEQDQRLVKHISKLSAIRKQYPALQKGNYEQIVVRNQQLIFARSLGDETVYTVLNLQDETVQLEFGEKKGQDLINALNEEEGILNCENGQIKVQVAPFTGKVLVSSERYFAHKPLVFNDIVNNHKVFDIEGERESDKVEVTVVNLYNTCTEGIVGKSYQ